MKEIFKRLEGREWEHNGYKITDIEHTMVARIWVKHYNIWQWNVSIADLLANKSWCKAVWGEEQILPSEFDIGRWDLEGRNAFQILRMEGEEKCLTYITETMI